LGDFSQDRLFVGKLSKRSIYSASMQDDSQRQILDAFFVILKPIAKILLRCGIGFREFAEVAKAAFVDVASSEYGLRGRPTNISRVAVMTGLTRKEVRRLRDKIESGEHSLVVKSTPMCEVLHRWHSEPEFLDDTGKPQSLPFSGERGSFSSLVKRFGGDIPPGAMRTELKRVGALEERDDGVLDVIKRSVSPAGIEDKLVVSLVHGAYPLLSAVAHNVNPDRDAETWPQITAFTQSVRNSDMPRIRRISLDRLTDIAESFDDLFIAYETLHESERQVDDQNMVAVGVFYYEDTDVGDKSPW
jgi:hypothetical protein